MNRYTDVELTYSATARCRCGAGLAYPSDRGARERESWVCSRVLRDGAPEGEHDSYPFAFYEAKSERTPSANGATTRPAEAPRAVDPALALRVAQARAARFGYELVLPGDPRREAVVYGLAAVHKLTGDGWDIDHARENVCVTLPGLGSVALGLLAAIPVVGPLLAAAAGTVERPQVYLSPAAVRDGNVLLGTIRHEEGHVGQIRAGGLAWCVAYGVIDEARAGAEAPCYGADLAVRAALGESPRRLYDAALESLRAYGLGDDIALAEQLVRSTCAALEAGADPGGIGADVLADLAAARVTAVPS